MKYLEYTPLDRINDFLSHVNLGERTIKGCLEAYSCKHTGTDKKLCLVWRTSAVKAHQFFTEESWDSFKQIFDIYMFEASKEWLDTNEGSALLETLYKALDEVVKVAECEIYTYNPEADADPFLERGAIWSYHFFFYNRRLKRVVSFRFSCVSNLVGEGHLLDDSSFDEDGEIFDGMDM
ncbi:hypothetical protein RND71_023993 [Anisodus tanguticus]|uniref:Repressor of RNA polymerase III transcription n=1 Tax=Anisodus tanguticus TaxID=243964 RepID=A0AAE1RWP6_9SOLA|nr:hypothetical protein RND71_023993 [Anisodus tanguticus]